MFFIKHQTYKNITVKNFSNYRKKHFKKIHSMNRLAMRVKGGIRERLIDELSKKSALAQFDMINLIATAPAIQTHPRLA